MRSRARLRWLAAAGVLVFGVVAEAGAVTIESRDRSWPAPGIKVIEGRTSSPSADFVAAKVDLCEPGVYLDTNAYGGYQTTSAWARGAGADLAVNADFFTSSGGAHIYGDAVAGGVRWPSSRTGRDPAFSSDWYHMRYGWIAVGDGWAEFSNSRRVKNKDWSSSGWRPDEVTTEIPSGTWALASGFPQIVMDGAPVTCSSPTDDGCFKDRSDMRARHPRTAMGLSDDRETMILLVVDGRSSRSSGMYGTELADLMHQLGAHTAFNLDGGGSSQMWVRGRGTINSPSDGSPRSVLNHWGVFTDGAGLSACPPAPPVGGEDAGLADAGGEEDAGPADTGPADVGVDAGDVGGEVDAVSDAAEPQPDAEEVSDVGARDASDTAAGSEEEGSGVGQRVVVTSSSCTHQPGGRPSAPGGLLAVVLGGLWLRRRNRVSERRVRC